MSQSEHGSTSRRRRPSVEPWYRREGFWLLMATIFLPFGWVLPLSRLAWSQVAVRRERRR